MAAHRLARYQSKGIAPRDSGVHLAGAPDCETRGPEQVYLASSDLLHTHLALAGMCFDSYYYLALQEPPTVKQGGQAAPQGWPSAGSITYDNVTAAYRPGLPPALSNLSFTIEVCITPICAVG